MDAEFDDKYIDASLPNAVLLIGDKSIHCFTLGEAVTEWHRWPKAAQAQATVKVGGNVYTAEHIGQMHVGPKPSAA